MKYFFLAGCWAALQIVMLCSILSTVTLYRIEAHLAAIEASVTHLESHP